MKSMMVSARTASEIFFLFSKETGLQVTLNITTLLQPVLAKHLQIPDTYLIIFIIYIFHFHIFKFQKTFHLQAKYVLFN